MKQLCGQEIVASQQPLTDVFRDGYGERYVGDEAFARSYIVPAHVAIIDDRHEDINAAALIRNSRVTAAATRSDRERFGSRFQNFVGLLHAAYAEDNDAWIGVGLDAKETVRAAAGHAGMSPSNDRELLEARLARSGKIASYIIRSDAMGLQFSLATSNHGANYWQQVWDWNTK